MNNTVKGENSDEWINAFCHNIVIEDRTHQSCKLSWLRLPRLAV